MLLCDELRSNTNYTLPTSPTLTTISKNMCTERLVDKKYYKTL